MSIKFGVPDEEPQTHGTETRTAGTRTATTQPPSWVSTGDTPRINKVEPPPTRGPRLSPSFDPLARIRIGTFAKWIMLLGLMLLVAWLPLHLHSSGSRDAFWLAEVTTSTIFAVVVATGLPRALLPSLFGQWHEAVEAFRDWIVVGLTTGILYLLGINVIRSSSDRSSLAWAAETYDAWLRYRLPLLIVCAVIGVLISRMLTIRSQGILGQNDKNPYVQVLVQAALVGALERPFEKGIIALLGYPIAPIALQWSAIACAAIATSILFWAYTADAKLMALRKGVVAGAGPVELTLTVIGGRNAGKTVLLAAAYYEWTTQKLGNLRIMPSANAQSEVRENGTDLQKIANDLYVNRDFPIGSVICQDLPFDLYLGSEQVARFRFLDYPGGAFVGRFSAQAVEEFYHRVDETDGVLLVADMSYVRLGKKEDDWLEVRNAFRTVLQRLIDRNGRTRVVPVALVMTKCDEYVDQDTGLLRMADLEEGLRWFQYLDLEDEWRQLCARSGPGLAEFTIWFTSAITYSMPRFKNDDENEDFDMSRSFRPVPPPSPITPTGCAAPLLWLSAKVMRWNVTMFRDLSSFIFGSSPKVRQRIEAVMELERVANLKAAQVKE